MANGTCPKCGMDHARLGLQLVGKVLCRRVHGSRHRLQAHGGAYCFSVAFWDSHREDFAAVQIHDDVDGSIYYADATALQRAFRQTFNPAVGPQVVIPIGIMAKTRSAPRRHSETLTIPRESG